MKPIPHEKVEAKKILKVQSHDIKALEKTYLELQKYLKKEGKMPLGKINSLLDGMHRSVIIIQKKKRRTVEKASGRDSHRSRRS